MQRIAFSLVSAALVAAYTLMTPSASLATVGFSWVGPGGSDSNDCSNISTPCATLAGAYAQTGAGGKIACVSGAAFEFQAASLNITHSISIHCEDGARFLLANGNDFLTVNTGPADVVALHGLNFESFILSGILPGLSGVHFIGGGTLVVEKCTFRSFTSSGLIFQPNSAGKLTVTDSAFIGNGSGSTGAGVRIAPQAGGSAQATLVRTDLTKNVFGVAVDGSSSTAGINAAIVDSVASANNQDGIIAITSSGHAPIGVMVKNTKSMNNAIGIRSIGPNVTVRVDGSTVTGNSTGLATLSGGALLTYGNNNVDANGTNGAFTGSVGLQ